MVSYLAAGDPHVLTKLFRALPEPGDPVLGQIRQKDIKINKKACYFFKVKFLKMVFRNLIRSGLLAHGRRPWAFGPWPKAMGLRPMAEGHGLLQVIK